MTRLRRSLRGGAAERLTKEERYEKLIRYVADPQYQDNLRQFHMPTYILANIDKSTTTKSQLESFGIEVLLNIIDNLDGNDQISVSLTCKTLAAVAEASDTRKIANISHYILSGIDPAEKLRKNISPWSFIPADHDGPTAEQLFQWRSIGFGSSSWGNTFGATSEQHDTLKTMIGKYLGSNYRYCESCRKFRTTAVSFWMSFADYENAGVTKRASEKVTAAMEDWNDATKIRKIVPPSPWEILVVCPAHDLLVEKNGRRVIELTDEEQKAAQMRKVNKRKRGRGAITEVEGWK